jgi:hypothetical protein
MIRKHDDAAHSRAGARSLAGAPSAGARSSDEDTDAPLACEGRRKLAALASSALALPGMAGNALADAPTERVTANYTFGYYREDPLPLENLTQNVPLEDQSLERYQIYTNQFNVLVPITRRIDGGIDVVFESMAGASPWYVELDGLQAMSRATITESRTDILASVNHYFDRSRLSVAGGISTENDYFSGNLAFSGQRSYNDQNTTLSLAMGFSWDTITPTDQDIHPLPMNDPSCNGPSCEKKTFALDFSFSQLLYRNATGMFSISYKKSDGFLSDPYKLVYIPDPLGGFQKVNDKRPQMRDQLTLMGRYRHHIPALNASVHGDISYHWDDWGIDGLSLEASWYQTFFDIWQIIPMFRYYSQSQADFYGPVFRTEIPEFRSSDYRLSPYGAMSVGLRTQVMIRSWPWKTTDLALSLAYQRYMANASWALGNVVNPNPALVSYHLATFGLGGRF